MEEERRKKVKLKKSIIVNYHVANPNLLTSLLELGLRKCEDIISIHNGRRVLIIFKSGQFCRTDITSDNEIKEYEERGYFITMGTPQSVIDLVKENLIETGEYWINDL